MIMAIIMSESTIHGCDTNAIHARIAYRRCYLSRSVEGGVAEGRGLFAPDITASWNTTLALLGGYLPMAEQVKDFHRARPAREVEVVGSRPGVPRRIPKSRNKVE